ncbi:MAG TPA: radical SAM protein [Candidatus Brocadiia bacterium]|nr:radical SAM protein [Candidatus Brocadiia bacterium]
MPTTTAKIQENDYPDLKTKQVPWPHRVPRLLSGRNWMEYGESLKRSINSGDYICPPTRALVRLTTRCCGKCNYCNWWAHKGNDLPFEQMADFLRQFAAIGGRNCSFFGGETLLHPQIIELVELCRKLEIRSCIVSNGLPLTRPMLKELTNAGLDLFLLSIDSIRPDVYPKTRGVSFDRIKPTLELLEEDTPGTDVQVVLASVVTSQNIDDPLLMADFCQERDWGLFFQPVHRETISPPIKEWLRPDNEGIMRINGAMEELCKRRADGAPLCDQPEYLRYIGNFFRSPYQRLAPCLAAWLFIYLYDDGVCYPGCGMGKPGVLGKQTLKEIWESRSFRISRFRMKHGLCRGCWWNCQVSESIFWAKHIGLPLETIIKGSRCK